jgi:hypothetical protein
MCFVYRDTDRRNPNRDGTEAIPQITNWTGRGRLPLPPREGRAPSRPIFSSLLRASVLAPLKTGQRAG